jgi:hypothetical protein
MENGIWKLAFPPPSLIDLTHNPFQFPNTRARETETERNDGSA